MSKLENYERSCMMYIQNADLVCNDEDLHIENVILDDSELEQLLHKLNGREK